MASPLQKPMKNNLSRRLYNSSLTLAVSFGFYALIFAFTLSCDAEESPSGLPNSTTEEAIPSVDSVDTNAALSGETVSYVENVTN